MAKHAPKGNGSIRKRADGLWEARFSYKDALGQPKRGSVYGKTQKECRQKLTAALAKVDANSFSVQQRYTVESWLKLWLETYCTDLAQMTLASYKSKIKTRIVPYIGKTALTELSNVQIQKYYNVLAKGDADHKPLSPKSIQNVHGIIHKSLDQAVAARILTTNPSDHVKLPKILKADLHPLMDDAIPRFMEAIKGDPFERVFLVDMFTGLRQSEILGLQWEDINFEAGEITVRRQMQKDQNGPGYVFLDYTKSHKVRVAAMAPYIVNVLKEQRREQMEWRLAAGTAWQNERNLVFVDRIGNHLHHPTVYKHFKKIVRGMGMSATRFHDLRHSYAISALQAGDSVKAVQEQLGHYSSAFTMDTYAAVSDTMRQQSKDRMEAYIRSLEGKEKMG